MHQRELIIDILYEIFRYFVALDPDGPFTLMLVCTAWQDMVHKHPPLWSWIHMDPEVGDLEARMSVGITLSAHQPLYLNLYMPYPPSFIGFIRPHVHRIHSFVVHIPMDLKMDEAAGHVSKMVHDLHLDQVSLRFLRGGEEVFYSPANIDEILTKHSLGQPFDSPICPSNMITALTLNTWRYGRTTLSLHALLTWLSLNVHLVHLEVHIDQFTMESKTALPIVSLPSLLALIIRFEYRFTTERGAIFLRHIQSPNSIAITLSGYSESFAAISEIRVGLRPSAMTLSFGAGDVEAMDLPAERLETMKMALSSVRHLDLHASDASREDALINQLVQCLPRSAVLRISCGPYSDEPVSLIDHPTHLIQLAYLGYYSFEPPDSPSIPAWCRATHPFDSLSLDGYAVGLIASFCKRLFLIGARTLESFINSQINLQIEELKCDSEVHGKIKPFPPKVGELNNLSKLTCTLSFAMALLQQRQLPMLRELILINSPAPTYGAFRNKWESFNSLLIKTSPTRTPMRLLSIPIWTPWVPLFNIAMLLSRGNTGGIIPTLVLSSLPHIRILDPLVGALNGELIIQTDDLPSWKSQENCEIEDICYECHNGGWVCADLKGCRRGRKGEPVSITRYTLSN